MFVLRVRREVGCFVGGSFRASRLGLRRCLLGLGVGGWMLNFVFSSVRRGRLARLGRRVSDRVAAFKVSRLVGGW